MKGTNVEIDGQTAGRIAAAVCHALTPAWR